MGTDDRIGDVSTFLWWFGWRFEGGVALGIALAVLIGAATGTPVGFFIGAITGLGLWYLGTKEIERTYWTLLETYAEYTKQVRENAMETTPHESAYTLNYSTGISLFVMPDERYFTTCVLVGERAVTFHEGVGVDMVDRRPYYKDVTTEIRYEWISSIRYEKPYVRIELTSGKSIRYYANDRPDELLADVRDHVQRHPQDISEKTADWIQREFN